MTSYIIKFKDDNKYHIEMTAEDLYDGSTLYESTLKSTTDDTSVGMMNFSKKKSKIWLYKIEINEEYHNLGLGTKMMRFLDYMANKTRCNSIEGKYYPSVNYGEHFYKKNGYSIEKEGYETEIYKYLGQTDKIDDEFIVESEKEVEDIIL